MPSEGNSKHPMDLQQRINAFVQLGRFLAQFSSEIPSEDTSVEKNDLFFSKMHDVVRQASFHNGWFTEENLRFAFKNWSEALTRENLTTWVSKYDFNATAPKTIAVVMAGNIPLVGFHDFLSVLITGNKVLAKLSSNDKILLPFIATYLIEIAPEFTDKIEFTEGRVTDFDAVIATGSNNTAKHFEYYFGKYPNIIRKNRNSVAVLHGKETKEELEPLATDVFQYFGLGCRNVSKLFLPENFDFHPLFEAMFSKKEYINNHKYINNYDYNKAVYLMSDIKLLDNEFLLLKEDEGYSSPIAVLFYEYYKDVPSLKSKLKADAENIQAVIASVGIENEIPYGQAQHPALSEYADGVDTVKFLIDLKSEV